MTSTLELGLLDEHGRVPDRRADRLRLASDYHHRPGRRERPCGSHRVTHQGPTAQGVEDLGTVRPHTRAPACGQDDG